MSKLTIKQAIQRRIIQRYTNRACAYGRTRWNADRCGSKSFQTAREALEAYCASCITANVAPE